MLKRFDQPAMGTLITFEAAARTGSFTKAALELAVGPPAVSHAIRLLEDDRGVVLFARRHQGVELTEAGRYLLEQVSLGLTLMDQALREVRSLTPGHQVTLAVSTATATWWLMPRIARFKQQHPDIELTEAFNFVAPVQDEYTGSMHLLFEGAVLAVLVVWLFLRDWRATLVSAVALQRSLRSLNT